MYPPIAKCTSRCDDGDRDFSLKQSRAVLARIPDAQCLSSTRPTSVAFASSDSVEIEPAGTGAPVATALEQIEDRSLQ
jgi:hypothetical protein